VQFFPLSRRTFPDHQLILTEMIDDLNCMGELHFPTIEGHALVQVTIVQQIFDPLEQSRIQQVAERYGGGSGFWITVRHVQILNNIINSDYYAQVDQGIMQGLDFRLRSAHAYGEFSLQLGP
jgi:hypothetical protein